MSSYPPPPPYQPGVGAGTPTDVSAIVALVLGIASIVMNCACALVSPVLGIVALVLGILARQRIGRSQGAVTGSGIAMGGIVTGVVGGGIGVLLIVLRFATFLLSAVTSSSGH
jgi:hypothetical protein